MKKLLIISYFFPPCNLTASQRVFSWARYFHLFNIYPIIITRRWDLPIKHMGDANQISGPELQIEKHEHYEVHYLPYTGSKRDRLLQQKSTLSSTILRKFLTLFEQVTQFFNVTSIPYSNFYSYAKQLIKKEQIDLLVISANPYPQFYFGYLLKKEFPKLNWFADYRDDWNTKELTKSSLFSRIIKAYEVFFEKKYLHQASAFFCVSDMITQRIEQLVGTKGYTIANGYFEEEYAQLAPVQEDPKQFTVVYTGQIYEEQDFSLFLTAFKKAIQHFGDEINLHIHFIGATFYPSTCTYLNGILEGYSKQYTLHDRMSYMDCMQLEHQADLLLMVAYGNLKGIPSSKLYNYVGFQKPVMCCPSDADIIDETLTTCGVGYCTSDADEAFTLLQSLITSKIKGTLKLETRKKMNTFEIEKLSRRKQTEVLASILQQY